MLPNVQNSLRRATAMRITKLQHRATCYDSVDCDKMYCSDHRIIYFTCVSSEDLECPKCVLRGRRQALCMYAEGRQIENRFKNDRARSY